MSHPYLKIFISLLFFTSLNRVEAFTIPNYLKNPKNPYSVSTILNRYKRKDLIGKLKKFVFSTKPSRFPGTEGHAQSAAWISTTISSQKEGTIVEIQQFDPDFEYAKEQLLNSFDLSIKEKYQPKDPEYQKHKRYRDSMLTQLSRLKNVKGRNVIWEKKGTSDKKAIILGAHYDSFALDREKMVFNPKLSMPGADDNASGVAALLALIEILDQLEIKRTVRIIFFDMHEIGFLGSKAYVEKYSEQFKEQAEAFINVEMIGHDTKIQDKEKKYKNFKIYVRDQKHQGHTADKNFAKKMVELGKKARSPLKVEISSNNYDHSDHRFFWQKGLKGLSFSQNLESDFNDKNHTENDFPETLNMKTFYYAFQFLAGSVISMAFDIDP